MFKLPLTFLAALGAFFAAHAAPAVAATARPPNILILLADDAAWGDFSFTGNTNLSTPNIDRIAREGAKIDHFYVCSVCVPTRAEFLTGRYYLRTGVSGVHDGRERINLDEKTVADAFKAAGYATGAFGKWHNGSQWPYHPNARGFDEYYGFTTGHSGRYFDAPLDHNGQLVRGQGYIADDFTDHALAFIEQNRDHPFFCYVPFNTPHSPLCVPDAYWDRFKEKSLALRAREENPENLDATRSALAMCENLDWNVGRLLAKLTELHLAENTIVVFFSDNGPAYFRWNGDMKGKKGTVDEGGVRAPFAIRWPGRIPAGATVREISGAIDLLPTLTQLAGIPRVGTKPLDGRDLSPLLFGAARDWPERQIFSHINWNQRVSVRMPRYRLDGLGALFDLDADPGQRTNLADKEPRLAADLARSVAAWRADVFGGGRDPSVLPDERPLTVGYAELPLTQLWANDGVPHGGVERSAKAPNSSYFTKWSGPGDSITWDIEVHQAGTYAATLYYTCAAADAGSTIELSFRSSALSGRIAPAWDPPLVTNEDRVPRDTESYLKDFRPLVLGPIRLEKGRGQLTLRATEISGAQVADVSLLTLLLQPSTGAP